MDYGNSQVERGAFNNVSSHTVLIISGSRNIRLNLLRMRVEMTHLRKINGCIFQMECLC